MVLWRRFVCKLYNFCRSAQPEEELDREITSHLALLQDDFMRKGMTADEALWAAKRAYGGIEQAKELHRNERSLLWLEQTRQDVRCSVRTLVRNPGFTITAVLALAIGIGANTAIFSVINAVLLKPLPFPDARRLVLFVNTANGEDIAVASPAEFNVWRKQTPVLQDVSAYLYSKINLTGVDRPEQVQLAKVSWTYFRLFGLSLARGRSFTASDDRPRGGDVVIVSESFWKRALSGDPEIIGKKIDLSGKPHEVIGIMAESAQTEAPGTSDPSSFRQTIDMWKPLQIDTGSSDQSGYLTVAARLRSGVTLAASNAELKSCDPTVSTRLSRNGSAFRFCCQNDANDLERRGS